MKKMVQKTPKLRKAVKLTNIDRIILSLYKNQYIDFQLEQTKCCSKASANIENKNEI